MVEPERVRPAAEVLKDADIALYRAKRLGRNRVEGYGAVVTQATALASWLRLTAEARPDIGEPSAGAPDGSAVELLHEAADLADSLQPGDQRLARLVRAQRFWDFHGEILFLGGGEAMHRARSQSINRKGATGQTVLNEVIAAALSKRPSGTPRSRSSVSGSR